MIEKIGRYDAQNMPKICPDLPKYAPICLDIPLNCPDMHINSPDIPCMIHE